ncbi:MAG: TetR/AcrR family transcriptional regulator [Deltaproteobacteria bacterium]|nr:TetR/AcrR family transcriptional regulator [Deltaproteobacteria bacterium]
MGRREDNQKLKAARIVAAAKALFSKQGHDATTTRQIARRARIAHGTLFLYAKTKADIVYLVFESEMAAAVQQAKASVDVGASLTDQAMHFYGAFIEVYARDPKVALALVKELPWLKGESGTAMWSITYEVLGAIANGVQAQKDRGVVDVDVDPVIFAGATFSLYSGALIAWLGGAVGDPDSDGRTAALLMLREGLRLLERGTRP